MFPDDVMGHYLFYDVTWGRCRRIIVSSGDRGPSRSLPVVVHVSFVTILSVICDLGGSAEHSRCYVVQI